MGEPPDHVHSGWVEAFGLILLGAIGAVFVWGAAAVFGIALAVFRFAAQVLS